MKKADLSIKLDGRIGLIRKFARFLTEQGCLLNSGEIPNDSNPGYHQWLVFNEEADR